jgi:hypothetical protein
MSTNFPTTSIDSFPTPASGQPLSNPNHITDTVNMHDAIVALETKVGVNNSSVITSLDYLVKDSGSNGGGHIQTANKGGTGQTSFNKGDILVAQSSSVLSKLAASPTNGYALITDDSQANGLKWGTPGNKPTIRTYGYSSSVITWTKPSTLSYLTVELVGPGGGGGAAQGGGGTSSAGGGGGGGAYTKKWFSASVLGATEQLTIGLKGAGGTVNANNGSTGSTTVFGASSLLSAVSGGGGTGSNGVIAGGGVGGVASGGDINIDGEDGTDSFLVFTASPNANGGPGGYSFLTTKGRGGRGATVITPTTSTAGQDGLNGFAIITEY